MKNKYLITQSLLSSWQWALKLDDGYDDFLKTLNREPIKPNKAMLDGQQFENVLNAVLDGQEIEKTHKWHKPISELAAGLDGASKQVRVSRDLYFNNATFVCYGVLDYLKGGIITDTKYSKTYKVGKYLDSPQAPMYMFLVPEAYRFDYKISDGEWVYTESYAPNEVEPIKQTIAHFIRFLSKMGLTEIYKEKWKSKY